MRGGRPVFVNTLFSCLATVTEAQSFRPLWRPPFVSQAGAGGPLPPERPGHGGRRAGLRHRGRARATSPTAGASGAAAAASSSTCQRGEIVGARPVDAALAALHDGRLWLLNSGTGGFGSLDLGSGGFEPVAFCPGYLRGLAFLGHFAVIGLSRPRENQTFTGLPLDEALGAPQRRPRCGLLVIDLRTGETVHWLRIEGIVDELYDVVALPGVRRPMALGLKTDEIRRILTIEE